MNSIILLGAREGKGEAIPVKARTGCEGSRKPRLPDIMTVGT
jgi:hypothetical protein